MTYRTIDFFSVTEPWHNPLKDVEHQPYFGGIEFSLHEHPLAQQAALTQPYSVLRRYYVKERADGIVDVSGLRNFILKKPSGIYVIRGDCGVGKTWFLRYFLSFVIPEELKVQIDCGIIDMLHRKHPQALDDAHWQLDLFLTEIVDKGVGLRTALAEEADTYAQNVLGHSGLRSRLYREEVDSYFRNLQKVEMRSEKNLLRFAYLERERRQIIIGIDNIDRYSDFEQSQLFQLMAKLLLYPNVRLIFPVRPSTYFTYLRYHDPGQFHYDDMELQKIEYAAMFRRRFSTSYDGVDLHKQTIVLKRSDFDRQRDNGESDKPAREQTASENQVTTNFPAILEIFLGSYGFQLLDRVADTDVRHALRLCKRVMFSDNLLAISNLEVGYHFISATMLRRSRDFRAGESYILNLFDDDHPDKQGNSLIRFRVLEYFIAGNRQISDSFFKKYFNRLGYKTVWIHSVLRLFVGSGLLVSADGREGAFEGVNEFKLTRLGRFYFEKLPDNKWYLYCIKRGMAIDDRYITRRWLKRGVWREEVEDNKLVQFIRREEELEAARIKRWTDETGESESKFGQLKSVGDIATAALEISDQSAAT